MKKPNIEKQLKSQINDFFSKYGVKQINFGNHTLKIKPNKHARKTNKTKEK